jgi:hypothetical protein
MPYFDFHVHPTLKSMFSKEPNKTSPWKEIDVTKFPWLLKWCTDFEYILCSQANLDQLTNDGYNLICIALFAPERGMTTADFLLKQAQSMAFVLNPDQLAYINQDSTRPIDLVLDDINNILLKPESFGITTKKIVVLKKGIVYDPASTDTLYVVFTIEGGHSISSSFNKASIKASDIIGNLNHLTSDLGWPIISMNLTHLEQYPLCNHAFGILFINNDAFYPTSKEISQEGIALIKECYSRKILIDLKHMSLGARRFLVQHLRKAQDFISINQPLVCTHAGFAGISLTEIPDYLEYHNQQGAQYGYLIWSKPKKYADFTQTSFNPSSINLYDEEIFDILQSDGILGLSMDKRILGYTQADPNGAFDDLVYEEEYISLQEKSYFLNDQPTSKKMDDFNCITNTEVQQGGTVDPEVSDYHQQHFMAHLLHFFKIALKNNYPIDKAMTQICIGSDFEGIINPIWCCPTVNEIHTFKNKLAETLPSFIKANAAAVSLPATFDVGHFLDLLFYENGKNFVLNRLKKINS